MYSTVQYAYCYWTVLRVWHFCLTFPKIFSSPFFPWNAEFKFQTSVYSMVSTFKYLGSIYSMWLNRVISDSFNYGGYPNHGWFGHIVQKVPCKIWKEKCLLGMSKKRLQPSDVIGGTFLSFFNFRTFFNPKETFWMTKRHSITCWENMCDSWMCF